MIRYQDTDTLRSRAEQRAERLREASMSQPHIDVERVRPAVRDDGDDQLAAARGVLVGLLVALAFWAGVIVGVTAA